MSYMDDYVNSLISRHNTIPKPAPKPRPAPKPAPKSYAPTLSQQQAQYQHNANSQGGNTYVPYQQDRGADPSFQRAHEPVYSPDRGADPSFQRAHQQPTHVPYNSGSSSSSRSGNTSSWSGNSGGGASGGGGARQAPAPRVATPTVAPAPATVVAPKPPPEPVTTTITIPDPTSDATYKEQHAEYAKALDDFTNSQGLAKKQYGTSYGAGLRKLGWNGKGWDQRDTNEGYGQSFVNNEEDFASRGAYNSGLYGKSVADIGDQFGAQKTDLDNANKDFGDNQVLALGQYQHTNSSQDRNALRESMGRIAQKYGVDPNDINQNRPTTIVRDANGKQISAK